MGLTLEHVTKRFGTHTAVNQLHLYIPNESLFGFLGGNGAGKTTTFRMILGLLDATEGTILWNGEPISYDKSHLIGYLPEERGLYPKLKVKEQLIYLGRLRGMNRAMILKELKPWLKRFKLSIIMISRMRGFLNVTKQKFNFDQLLKSQLDCLLFIA